MTSGERPSARPSGAGSERTASGTAGAAKRAGTRRGLVAVLSALVLVVAVITLVVRFAGSTPSVVTTVMPGSFTGYAFDVCQAPSQRQMDAWVARSPYAAVGIYIAGENRACPDQRNLDKSWVAAQARHGWRLLPVVVGRQAPCGRGTSQVTITPQPAQDYAAARAQGRAEAGDAADAARDLGIAPGSTLWLDVEAFDISRVSCRLATLSYVAGWTDGLRAEGFAPGVYSSAVSGWRMLAQGRGSAPLAGDAPDQVWVADWNDRPTAGVTSATRDGWPHGRVHQYRGPHDETYGGVTLQVDSNYLVVGGTTAAAPDRHACLGSRPSAATQPGRDCRLRP
ncbi:DUF1906 domain-containing protein [Oryzihumus sp.]|uniref:DUF1906 domain-containing protein n=1 Tax=Oryzihumus sp. TaxID=1968903 RepID=UPI002ED929DB